MARKGLIERKTLETDIKVNIDIDNNGEGIISTGIGFFDHMLLLFAKHGGFLLECKVTGDLIVDYHHTVEDTGIALGEALKKALGDKKGINRYGTFYVPMMDTLARVSLDLSGRPYLAFGAEFKRDKVGEFDTELVKEFFIALSNSAGIDMHIDIIRGENTHHMIEAIFKAFARALKDAVKITGTEIPSTKGII